MRKKLDLTQFDARKFTHFMVCRQQICRNGYTYRKLCTLLSETGAKARVVVFGYRNNKLGEKYTRRVQYVDKRRLLKRGDVDISKYFYTSVAKV